MFKHFSFICLWIGQALANLGDHLYVLAIISYIYKHTGSAGLAALVPFIRLFTQLLSSLVAPLVMEKLHLRTILITSQAIQSVLYIFLILYLTQSDSSLILLSSLIALLSFLPSWIHPSRNALLPRLVQDNKIVRANAMMSITDQAIRFTGWLVGGVLISQLGNIHVLWITLILYILSTSALYFIQDTSKERFSRKKPLSWRTLLEGWSYVKQHASYRRLFATGFLESMAASVWTGALILVFVKEILHKEETWWGFLNGAWLLGTIVSSLVLSKWIEKRLTFSFLVGFLGMGILTLIFAVWGSIPTLALLIAFGMGIPYQIHDIAKRTLLQIHANPQQLPKIFALYHAMSSVSYGLGLLLMGYSSDRLGSQSVYFLSAIFILIATWLAKNIRK